jgi:hypothetical protein
MFHNENSLFLGKRHVCHAINKAILQTSLWPIHDRWRFYSLLVLLQYHLAVGDLIILTAIQFITTFSLMCATFRSPCIPILKGRSQSPSTPLEPCYILETSPFTPRAQLIQYAHTSVGKNACCNSATSGLTKGRSVLPRILECVSCPQALQLEFVYCPSKQMETGTDWPYT